ncbi:hypothetical protein V8C35DRAFT_303162 [Trichoderma chlorosporum]
MMPVFLAPQIIQRIIFFLIHDLTSPESRSFPYWRRFPEAVQYACVSRLWQEEIERETFANLHLNWDRLSQLNSIVTPQRRRFVRSIRLEIDLPKPGPQLEPAAELKLRNNQATQDTFEALLQSLSHWDTTNVHYDGVKLSIHAPLPKVDARWKNSKRREWEYSFSDSALELTNPERIGQLPPAAFITNLAIDERSGRHISPVALCVLLAKLPASKHVSIDWWKSLRFARMRNDLADVLCQLQHPIDTFNLYDSDFTNINQAGEPEQAPEPLVGNEDEFSKSVHVISQRVKDFRMQGIAVSDEIFFPRMPSINMAESLWDRLVRFRLFYPPITPSGQLLFLPSPYRTEPFDDDASEDSMMIPELQLPTLDVATAAMQQFYLSAARAALQMPKLKEMELVAELGNPEYWHQFRYHVQGMSAKVIWTSSSGFAPENEVLELWRKVPRKHLQAELDVELSSSQWAW